MPRHQPHKPSSNPITPRHAKQHLATPRRHTPRLGIGSTDYCNNPHRLKRVPAPTYAINSTSSANPILQKITQLPSSLFLQPSTNSTPIPNTLNPALTFPSSTHSPLFFCTTHLPALTLFSATFSYSAEPATLLEDKQNLKFGRSIPEIGEQISLRGWRRLSKPRTKISKDLVHEFYSNAVRTEEQLASGEDYPYTSYVRGKEVDFSAAKIREVLRIRHMTLGAETDFKTRQFEDQRLDDRLGRVHNPFNDTYREQVRDHCG
ncbi:hypothetical protein PIB30_059946 [Stylosanthes scabra]|uniref:Putative plant transposon protein domain-containing protein n=1 Tax=Stylosanthes scabra TaxID=79078 RepID=A0ABU6QKV1_9FABA|nr:hypothetical protein [Stylosanthes scabra]